MVVIDFVKKLTVTIKNFGGIGERRGFVEFGGGGEIFEKNKKRRENHNQGERDKDKDFLRI